MALDGTEVEVLSLGAEEVHSEETGHEDHDDEHSSASSENCHFHAGVE